MNDGKLLHLLAHFKKLIVIESNIFSDSKPYIFSLFQGGGHFASFRVFFQ